jgi:tripartite-type tricarboxylate transporter receptor subunit TctC
MNQLPADGLNIVGINLPHIVLQPLEGQVQYRTEDVTPVYWFHYTPDALVVTEGRRRRRSRKSSPSAARD